MISREINISRETEIESQNLREILQSVYFFYRPMLVVSFFVSKRIAFNLRQEVLNPNTKRERVAANKPPRKIKIKSKELTRRSTKMQSVCSLPPTKEHTKQMTKPTTNPKKSMNKPHKWHTNTNQNTQKNTKLSLENNKLQTSETTT